MRILGIALCAGAFLAAGLAALAAKPRAKAPASARPALPGEQSARPALPLITPEPGFAEPATVSTTRSSGAALPQLAPMDPVPLAAPMEAGTRPAAPGPEEASGGGPFKIGYLPSEGEIGEPLALRLSRTLAAIPALRRAMREAGFSGEVQMAPADGFNDLAARLQHEEFDLAFCPAAIHASLAPWYQVILQEMRPGDTADPRGKHILRKAVIFAGPASSLFGESNPTSEAVKKALAEGDFATPSAFDAAGYYYPCLELGIRWNAFPRNFRWCGSAREVVRHVVSGLAPMGACDEAGLERELALAPAGLPRDKMVRVISTIPHVPADPVLVRPSLHPRQSALGKELKKALKGFFRDNPDAPFTLEDGPEEENYGDLRNDLQRFEKLRKEALRR